jgi:hypothetical protein
VAHPIGSYSLITFNREQRIPRKAFFSSLAVISMPHKFFCNFPGDPYIVLDKIVSMSRKTSTLFRISPLEAVGAELAPIPLFLSHLRIYK